MLSCVVYTSTEALDAGGKSSARILLDMSSVPVAVQKMRKIQTEDHPKASWSGPTANSPIDAVMDPQPLINPVTVPSDLLLPRTEGCDAKSAATAEVIMLLGLCYHQRGKRKYNMSTVLPSTPERKVT